jgi:MSHA biogenesis protein MshN
VVTDLVFRLQAQRAPAAAPPRAPAAPAAQAPAPAAAAPAPAAAAAPAATAAGGGGAEAANVDLFKLATEIATPFEEKDFAAKPGPARRAARLAATPPLAEKREGRSKPAAAARAPLSKAPARIDKRVHLSTPAERAEEEYRKASALLNQGRVAEAMDGYRRSLGQEAGHGPARQALVGLLLEHRRIDEAQRYLQDGLSLHPQRFDYAVLLARIQVERGDLQGAHALLSRHAASAAGDAEYQAFDAALLQRLGRHSEAVTGYQAALRLAPRAGLWWMGMGISLQAENRSAEALDAFRRARAVGGLSPDLLAFVDQRVKQLQ